MEDVARYRDGVGVSRRRRACRRRSSAPVVGALDGLLARWARTHGPFLPAEPARRWGLPIGVVDDALHRARRRGHAAQRRVPARRRGARAVRPGGAAAPAPAVAGQAPARGGAGRSGDPRAVPARRGRASPPSPSAAGAAITVPRIGGARAPRRGRRPARRPADPGLGPGARRAARRGSPATSRGCSTSSARWARSRGSGRGSLGRDDGRVVPASGRDARLLRPDRPAATASSGPGADLHERIRAHLRRRGRLVLPRAVHGGGGAVRPRGARRAVGPRLGGRGHQRHVRAAPGAALEAAGEGLAAPAGPADVARAARGRRAAGRSWTTWPTGRRRRRRRGRAEAQRRSPRRRARSASTRRRWPCSIATAC